MNKKLIFDYVDVDYVDVVKSLSLYAMNIVCQRALCLSYEGSDDIQTC
jgi:hypothetical protein